jgi:cysteine desulfurase/selenocysteine lyase
MFPFWEYGEGIDRGVVFQMLRDKPRIYAFPHIPNTMAITTPAATYCAMACDAGVVMLIDAIPSAAHSLVDVQEIGCDFLACSAHKMCGPTGLDLLYGLFGLLDSMPPGQFRGEIVDRVDFKGAKFRLPSAKFEAGTPSIIEPAGMHAALRGALSDNSMVPAARIRFPEIRQRLRIGAHMVGWRLC